MGLAQDFANMGEEFINSFDARVGFLGKNIVDTHRFLQKCRNDHKAMGRKQRTFLHTFVGDVEDFVKKQQAKFRKDHHTMGKKQRTDLHAFTEDLTDKVHNLQKKFQKEQHAVHQECRSNHKAWENVAHKMAQKRRNFRNALKLSKQKAGRTHG